MSDKFEEWTQGMGMPFRILSLEDLKMTLEMPEGWRHLKLAFLKYLEDDEEDFACPGCLDQALELMKEMAEALDDMVKACNQGYGRDIKKMEIALKKFQEWK